MSICRIDNEAGHTHGWQARAHVGKGHPRLTRFFADSHGGRRIAKRLAEAELPRLQRQAKRIKRQLLAASSPRRGR